MKSVKVHLENTFPVSQLILDLISEDSKIKDFINGFPNINNVKKNLKREINISNRKTLSKVLLRQYENTDFKKINKSLIYNNIESLTSPTTHIISTGHQLHILCNPLFLIYKISSIIALSKQLKKKFKKFSFVPCFWMATEDHDFEEINKLNFNNQEYVWNEDNSEVIGNLSSKKILNLLDKLKEDICKTKLGEELFEIYYYAYSKNINYANANRALINCLFGKYGLLIVDGNDINLKKIMIADFESEINNNFTYNNIIKTNHLLSHHYHSEINALSDNIFYIKNNIRGKISIINNKYVSLKHNINWSKSDLINELYSHPEHFSPNVFLRTIFQERLLSSLIYLGGSSEISYWVQLKKMFESRNMVFPILGLRSFFLILSKNVLETKESLNLSSQELFLPKHKLIQKIFKDLSKIDFSLISDDVNKLLFSIERNIKNAEKIPYSVFDIFKNKLSKDLIKLESKIVKIEKNNNPNILKNFMDMYDEIFYDGLVQERFKSFIPFYMKYGSSFFELLINEIIAFEKKYIILKEKD